MIAMLCFSMLAVSMDRMVMSKVHEADVTGRSMV